MSDTPDPIDVFVGGKIRERRQSMNLSMETLAPKIGVRYQQLAKYERATDRVSASRLLRLAHALNVSVDYFFDGIDLQTAI
jgi:transcriptional regulator with XRE-family HTH domain